MSPVGINGVDKQGIGINGVQTKQTLSAASETVNKGVFDATTLSAVDADLATGNILSGVTIFGFLGTVLPMDVSDADALVGDVLAPKTFYSVAAPRKTGTMAIVALDPALNAYPAGYHAGAASLTAVDADLATGNIKSGVTIFGVAGSATVQDISDADLTVAEAPTGKKFYAVTGGVKTGTGTKTLSAANETVAAGYYAATTLSAIDADLAVGNIKSGVTIFGFLGTYSATLSQDLVASATCPLTGANSGYYRHQRAIAAASPYDFASTTQNFSAASMAVGVAFILAVVGATGGVETLTLYMNGVSVAATSLTHGVTIQYVVIGTRALSGSKIVKGTVSGTVDFTLNIGSMFNTDPTAAGVAVGSIKAT